MRTRHWQKVEYIFSGADDGRLIATACSQTVHAWIRSDMVQIKFENDFLYQQNLNERVTEFLQANELELLSISRVDVAMDFTAFWTEQKFGRYSNPEKLIADFSKDKILHLGRCQFAVDGAELFRNFMQLQNMEQLEMKLKKQLEKANKGKIQIGTYKIRGMVTARKENNYLRFGTMNSDVAAYMYNKTKQLELVNKPWIKDNWNANGYDGKKDVWRLEISFKGGQKELCIVAGELNKRQRQKIATGKLPPANIPRPVLRYTFKDLNIIAPDVLPDLFHTAVEKHFSFCKNENLRNKARFKRIKLFDYKLPGSVLIERTNKLQSNRMDKIFVRMLDDTARELKGTADDLREMCNDVKQYYVYKRGMNEHDKTKFNNGTTGN